MPDRRFGVRIPDADGRRRHLDMVASTGRFGSGWAWSR